MTINDEKLKNAYEIVFKDIATKLIRDNHISRNGEQVKSEIKERLFRLLESDDLFDVIQLQMVALDIIKELDVEG